MTLRIRLMLRWAFFALPFQMRQCRRSTSATITAFAAARSGCQSINLPLPASLLQTHRGMKTMCGRPLGFKSFEKI
jgi:hypothetical protein